MGYFQGKERLTCGQHFLAGSSLMNWLRVFARYGGADFRYWHRIVFITLLALITAPFKQYERSRFRYKSNKQKQTLCAPVFIIGYFRSGTTFLHQLMGADTNFKTVSMMETMIPEMYQSCFFCRMIFRNSLPKKRPMDDVDLTPQAPEEEEYALANMTPFSFYHALCFPKQFNRIFKRYVLMENISREDLLEWRTAYDGFLRKIIFGAEKGKNLLLKNPANSARIPHLLQMYPDARFIFIARHPMTVFQSSMHWLDKEMELCALQKVNKRAVKQFVLESYSKLTKKYLQDRALVPEGRLLEIRFEDLEKEPLTTVKSIYRKLGLTWSGQQEEACSSVLHSLAGYTKNTYISEPDVQAEIYRQWKTSFMEWGYTQDAAG